MSTWEQSSNQWIASCPLISQSFETFNCTRRKMWVCNVQGRKVPGPPLFSFFFRHPKNLCLCEQGLRGFPSLGYRRSWRKIGQSFPASEHVSTFFEERNSCWHWNLIWCFGSFHQTRHPVKIFILSTNSICVKAGSWCLLRSSKRIRHGASELSFAFADIFSCIKIRKSCEAKLWWFFRWYLVSLLDFNKAPPPPHLPHLPHPLLPRPHRNLPTRRLPPLLPQFRSSKISASKEKRFLVPAICFYNQPATKSQGFQTSSCFWKKSEHTWCCNTHLMLLPFVKKSYQHGPQIAKTNVLSM